MVKLSGWLFIIPPESEIPELTFLFSVQRFDIATQLNTAPELVERVYNRPTLETLQKAAIQGATNPALLKVCTGAAFEHGVLLILRTSGSIAIWNL